VTSISQGMPEMANRQAIRKLVRHRGQLFPEDFRSTEVCQHLDLSFLASRNER
jgi:hypothetical protein